MQCNNRIFDKIDKFLRCATQADGESNSAVKKNFPKLKVPKKVILKTSRKKPAREGC